MNLLHTHYEDSDAFIKVMKVIADRLSSQNDGVGLTKIPFPRSRIRFMRDFIISTKALRSYQSQLASDDISAFVSCLVHFVKISRTLPVVRLQHALEIARSCLYGQGNSEVEIGTINKALDILTITHAEDLRVSASTNGVTNIASDEPLIAKPSTRRKSRMPRLIGSDEFLSFFLDSPILLSLAKAFLASPDDCQNANRLFFNYMVSRALDDITPFEMTIPMRKFRSAFPSSSPIKLLSANLNLLDRKYIRALDKYLELYFSDAEQPLVCLCIAALLIFLSTHTILHLSSKGRHDVYAKSLAFLLKYAELRNSSSSTSTPPTSTDAWCHQQEVFYNMGRFYYDSKLFHLSAKMYQKALQMADEHPSIKESARHVTFEAAHNLVLLYKQSDSMNLALDIMHRYLIF